MMMTILVLLALGVFLYTYLNEKASEEEGFSNMNSELMGNNKDQGGVKPSEGVGENEVFHEIKDKAQQQQMKRPENVPKTVSRKISYHLVNFYQKMLIALGRKLILPDKENYVTKTS